MGGMEETAFSCFTMLSSGIFIDSVLYVPINVSFRSLNILADQRNVNEYKSTWIIAET